MTDRQKGLLRDLYGNIFIAFLFAFGFYFFVPGPPKDVRATIISSFVFGFGFFGAGFFMRKARFASFAATVLLRSLIVWLTFYVCISVVIWGMVPGAVKDQKVELFSFKALEILASVVFSPTMLFYGLIGYVAASAINAFFQINKKLGPGVLRNWMLGKYHEPKEEERIFMFLDIRDSTMLAEKLGTIKFSRFVKDFFFDLTLPVTKTSGEVSHYIGDEAVLTWKPLKGLRAANCVQLFFLMRSAIAARETYYLNTYGVVPRFKAGVHIGPVVATEVGEIKSEIVYHGDVLNTTARIQGLCNGCGFDLLISGDLLKRLELPDNLYAAALGSQLLKGKEQAIDVYGVTDTTIIADVTGDVEALATP